MNVGEEKDLNLTFPENYKSADLAGQEVVFHVTLNAIKNAEETAIDDALAKRAMDDENATLDQLRSQVYGGLENQAESNFFNEAGSELLNQAIENSKVTCDPDAVDDMYDQLVTTYTAYAGQYGMELEEFLSMFLQTDKAGLRATAENLVKQEMVLNAIIEAEGIKATDEEKDKLAQMNYFADAEEMVSTYGEESANRLFQMGAAYYYLIRQCRTGSACRGRGDCGRPYRIPGSRDDGSLGNGCGYHMKRKALFFDIDGTLLSDHKKELPESAARVIAQARRRAIWYLSILTGPVPDAGGGGGSPGGRLPLRLRYIPGDPGEKGPPPCDRERAEAGAPEEHPGP